MATGEAYKPHKTGGGKRIAASKAGGRKHLLSDLLMIAGIVLLVAAASIWGWQQYRYYKQSKVNDELASYVTISDEEPGKPGEVEGNRGPKVDWEGLKAINDEVVAWLQIPGTQINYPVYQADNNERYLRNSASGEWTVGGQLFCDYLCTRPGMSDPLTLVYGHHLLDGSMFNSIADMDQQENFDAVETVWYVTEAQAFECEPLFLYYTQDDDQSVRTFTFESDEAFHTYLQERLARAVVQSPNAAEALHRVKHALCLITCNYYDGYGRTILVCAPKDEVAAPELSAG